jgi:hypothetical protein
MISTANSDGVAGQWPSGQLQPFEQHPEEWSAGADLCGFAFAASVAIAFAQASLMPSTCMTAGVLWAFIGADWECTGDDIVAKTNISPIRKRAQTFAMTPM